MNHAFHIYRYDPDSDAKPRMQVIELEVQSSDRMLLDVLLRLKAIDPSLAFRRSCRRAQRPAVCHLLRFCLLGVQSDDTCNHLSPDNPH